MISTFGRISNPFRNFPTLSAEMVCFLMRVLQIAEKLETWGEIGKKR